ncbi:tRNA1(Val) (adenine(37)-N6)-methyltransferase [Limobrevibacterium gyesilva]|uniref:Methyltransferase n=1 Tax=Limobrevibacterium gyesilva TaxID=2991712 RepID=A0AA41YPB6_9PROT|nr:methyltransferase [Limobrevibacterium gyesilva]MCW3474188.1 methyltransferase [Limobrevibacterium gyesilva]
MQVTRGFLLGGQLRHDQPANGHRTGIEPVLLAASVPAQPGQRVLEGGSGAGAALLCLARRVPGVSGVGVERDPALAALAGANAAANGFSGLAFVPEDLAAWRPDGVFDHAFANPPWHAPAGTASPDPGREHAKRAEVGLFALWTQRLAAPLRHRGTLTLVVAAAVMPACLAALAAAGCGSPAVLPLWPKAGRTAKLVLLRGVKGGRGPCRMLSGLVLHRDDGGYTDPAAAILGGDAPLPL